MKDILVTSPLLPELEEFHGLLREIWDSRWITNNGSFHRRLEAALAEYLDVPYLSLFTNGTLPLITALQALRITGEVITTPYSFVATTHALWWNGIKPVFVDVEPVHGNIDPERIEAAITPRTTAIMPVHVYGRPCDVDRIRQIADTYGLRVIYDAAHAFGVKSAPPIPPPRGGATNAGGAVGGSNGGNSSYRATRGNEMRLSDPVYYAELERRAKENRNNPTDAERVVWDAIRGNKLSGLHFRRQHIIEQYIVDFVCLEKGIIVEIDGGYHDDPMQKHEDEVRTQRLASLGFRVIRFTNEQVLTNLYHVLQSIEQFAANLVSPPLGGGAGGAARGLCGAGDMSTLSFHATKVYNTVEGGALICHDAETKKRIDYLKNFGFANETTVVAPGINSKMDEIRAAYGLLNLRQVDDAIERRRQVALTYREALKDVPGIRYFDDMPGVRHNYSYFPIFVDERLYGESRDDLYFRMRRAGVFGRRYFYPLISRFSTYRGLPSAAPENLPVAHRLASQVICLPMHHALSEEDIARVIAEVTHPNGK